MKKLLHFTLILGASACISCTLHPVSEFIAAARSGNVQALRAALANRSDPDERGGVNNWTVLMHAIHKNQPGSVHVLLEGGANPNAKAGKGVTPLIMAAGYGEARIVEDLLTHGADAKASDEAGFGPLDAAVGGSADIDRPTVGKCQDETVRVLLKHAPEIQLRDSNAV